jgi:hypothetical protein
LFTLSVASLKFVVTTEMAEWTLHGQIPSHQ